MENNDEEVDELNQEDPIKTKITKTLCWLLRYGLNSGTVSNVYRGGYVAVVNFFKY
jgi:hypothetical protein